MHIRRVVTGHDDQGRAIVTSDQEVDPVVLSLLPGFETFELWSTKDSPAIPKNTGQAGIPNYFPDVAGTVFRVVTFPPDTAGLFAPDFDFVAAIAEAQEKLPDLVSKLEPENPGMHTTDSVDYCVMIEGELDLELDDGRTIHVTPGCCIVQRGTRHAWRNHSDRPARVAFIVIGGTRAPELRVSG